MAGIIDQYGNPISSADLRKELAATRSISGRPPFAGHQAFGMDPGRLGAIIRAADYGNTLQWMITAEEIEELYPHYLAVLSKRKRQAAQLPVRVEAASDDAEAQRHADFVNRWLDADVLQNALFDVMDALGKGWSVSEIMWETAPGRVRPRELLYRPQRHFEVSWENGETIWLRDEGGFSDLAPHKFLLHAHKSKSGHATRSGLTRAVAFMWMYSAFTLKDWAVFVQTYGAPIRVGRYGPEASDSDKRALWRAVSSIAGDVAAIIPKSMEMEFVKDSDRAAGSVLFMNRADWLDRAVSKLVLGGTAGTDAISGGHAVGKEHRDAEQDIERFDARLLGVTITRRLVQPMIAFTFGPQAEYPRIVLGQEEKAPLAEVIAAVRDLGPQGLRVKAAELRERLDLTEPDEKDEVVGGVPADAAPPDPALDDPDPVPEANHTRRAPAGGLAIVRNLVLRHAEVPEEIVERMSAKLAAEAEGALAGMTGAVRKAFDEADDLEDLRRRIDALDLPQDAYAAAMARGMALANLVGMASVINELGRGAAR